MTANTAEIRTDVYEDGADKQLKELYELSVLYDYYGNLLKDHNKEIFEDYVLNNYSLGEIAERVNISRQGVRDIVQRCSKRLREYEDVLHIAEKSEIVREKIFEILSEAGAIVQADRQKEHIIKAANDITELL